jgi:hypothetical protein
MLALGIMDVICDDSVSWFLLGQERDWRGLSRVIGYPKFGSLRILGGS